MARVPLGRAAIGHALFNGDGELAYIADYKSELHPSLYTSGIKTNRVFSKPMAHFSTSSYVLHRKKWWADMLKRRLPGVEDHELAGKILKYGDFYIIEGTIPPGVAVNRYLGESNYPRAILRRVHELTEWSHTRFDSIDEGLDNFRDFINDL